MSVDTEMAFIHGVKIIEEKFPMYFFKLRGWLSLKKVS